MALTDSRKAVPLEAASPVAGPVAAALARLCFPIAFLFVDSAVVIAVATVAHWLPGNADESGWQGLLPGTRFVYPLVFWLVSLVALHVFGFYDHLRTILRGSELSDLYGAFTMSIVVTMALTVSLGYESSPSLYIVTWLAAPPAVAVGRRLLRRLRRQIFPASMLAVPLLLLGQCEESDGLLQRIESVPELDLLPIRAGSLLRGPEEVRRFVQQNNVRHAIVVPSRENQDVVAEMADCCHESGLRVAWLQSTAGLSMAISSTHTWEGTPVIHLSEPITQRFYEMAKRGLDLACVLVVLPVFLPLLSLISVAIKLDSPGPVCLRQRRVGRGGRMFDMYKFRTMLAAGEEIPEDLRARNEATGPMFKMRRDPRITRVGRFLRRTSLDEIPQLLNVLLGDMSLVGPRPPLPRELPGYDELQRRRLRVKPGITGLWQVSGRSSLTFEQMLALDVRYIQKRSLLLDVVIMLKTVPCVISGKGAF